MKKIDLERIKDIFQKIKKISKKREMKILPGQLAYFLFLSLIPTITLLGFLLTIVPINLDAIASLVGDTVPEEVRLLLVENFRTPRINLNIIFFMIMGFFVASNGPHSIIVASNAMYELEGKNLIKRRTKAIFMTVLLVSLFSFIVFVVAFGSMILKFILDFNLFSIISDELYLLFILFQWPVSLLFIFIIIKIIYTIAPDYPIPSKHVNKGAIFTTVCWSVVTGLYSSYVSNFANYGLFYGSLSNIIVLMIWVYILAYILVFGIAINASSYKRSKEEELSHIKF